METTSIMNIRPLYDRIVVKRIEEEETTRSGIVIPDSAKEKPQQGEVVAIGKGKRSDDGKLNALDVQVKAGRDTDAQIVELGKKLNTALAAKVEELQRYRSEFFGRLREGRASAPLAGRAMRRFM